MFNIKWSDVVNVQHLMERYGQYSTSNIK